MNNSPSIRIHHFFDILRDFGIGNEISADSRFNNSYHSVAARIRENPREKFKIVVGADSVCAGCTFLKKGICTDKIDKPGFNSKHEYNDYLDRKILKVSGLREGEVKSPAELCRYAQSYLSHMDKLYDLNDSMHTDWRKKQVMKGLEYYNKHHQLNLDLAGWKEWLVSR